MVALTVFTPTYNREYILGNCYESLCRQTSKDFEWIIVDDGSTDHTRELVEQWIHRNNGFEITYIYKENGGLHTGYNTAIEQLDSELAVCIDSDDFMPDDAVEKIIAFWKSNGSAQYAGIIGLDFDLQNHAIGGPLPYQKEITPIELHNNHIIGDRKYIVRSDLYKHAAPMPTFANEKNFNPHYLCLKISKDYPFLILNENVCYVDYQNDGMSANIFHQYLDSPNSFAELRRLTMTIPGISFPYLVRTALHYVSSNIIAKKKHFIKKSPKKLLTLAVSPFGFMLTLYIKMKAKKLDQTKGKIS